MVKYTRDGREVVLAVTEDGVHVAITVAGVPLQTAEAVVIDSAAQPTHPYAIGRVLLTTDEANQLRAEIADARRAYVQSPMGQAWAARRAITARMERAERYKDENYGAYLQARQRAHAELVSWRAQYPEAARLEHRRALMLEADDLRRQAADALAYDADGWLSPSDRQARHDDLMSQAAAKEAQAEAL
jgi:hypothetical protein